MHIGKLSRWLWLGLILDGSIMVWRIWAGMAQVIPLLPYRTLTEWAGDPPLYVIFYGLGFVGIWMAVTGDRRPLLLWNVCYLIVLAPPGTNPVGRILISGAAIATVAIFIGDRRMRMERRTTEPALLS